MLHTRNLLAWINSILIKSKPNLPKIEATHSMTESKESNQPNGEKKEVMKNNSVVVAQQQAGNGGG